MMGYRRNPLGIYQRLPRFIESRYDVTNACSILRVTHKIFRQDHSYVNRFVRGLSGCRPGDGRYYELGLEKPALIPAPTA